MTYTLIDSVTLASSASSVTFSSISATGKGDLVLICNPASGGSHTNIAINLNGDTSANYHKVQMIGKTSTNLSRASTDSAIETWYNNVEAPALVRFDFQDFASTDKHKTVLNRVDTLGLYSEQTIAAAFRWANTSAITTIAISGASPSYQAGSTFFLYQLVSE